MPHITSLSLPFGYKYNENSYDGVLRAIAFNMHHLKSLNISYCTVEPKAIGHLLPTEDNALGGCPELVDLNLWGILNVDVQLLKKIILALPKLRSLRHEIVAAALGDLTEKEMDEDTARCLSVLCPRKIHEMFDRRHPIVRYEGLVKSPAFKRFKNNITTVAVAEQRQTQEESALLADVLISLPKLRTLTLLNTTETNNHVLESVGDRIEYLNINILSGNLCTQDIISTCPNLVKLTLTCWNVKKNPLWNDNNLNHDQVERSSKQPVLNYLTKIDLLSLNKKILRADMLIALLQSPCLIKITLEALEAVCDDVMFNVFSSPGCDVLSKVTEFSVTRCPLITEAPFVHWLTRENCSLEYIDISRCEKVNHEILKAAAGNYDKPLIINRLF